MRFIGKSIKKSIQHSCQHQADVTGLWMQERHIREIACFYSHFLKSGAASDNTIGISEPETRRATLVRVWAVWMGRLPIKV